MAQVLFKIYFKFNFNRSLIRITLTAPTVVNRQFQFAHLGNQSIYRSFSSGRHGYMAGTIE